MKLLIGLGNDEARYNGTRHNIGFACVEEFARDKSVPFQFKDKFKASIAEVSSHGEKVLLIKPATFYNDSGQSYRALVDFYKLDDSDVLVIHDDIALPFGTVRTRVGGSDAGNNGIKSVNAHGGTNTMRMRIGIHTNHRTLVGDTDFVLGRFSQVENTVITKHLLPRILSSIDSFLSEDLEPTSFSIVREESE